MLPYTISEMNGDGTGLFNGKGFKITFCGSSRYAYDGCIDAYLTSGEEDDHISLMVRGEYVKAYMNSEYDGIVSK